MMVKLVSQRRGLWAVLIGIAVLIRPSGYVHAGATDVLRSSWIADLAKDPQFAKRSPENALLLRRPSVIFLDEDHLLVGYDDNFRKVDDTTSRMRSFGYHVLEIDARTGSFGSRRSFDVLNATSDIKPAGVGQFVLLQGETLTKFSSEFQPLADIPTPLRLHGEPTPLQVGDRTAKYPDYEKWQVDVSPDLSSLVLAHLVQPQQLELHWLNAQSLHELASTSINGGIRYGSTVSAGNENAILDFDTPETIDRPMLVDTRSQKVFLCGKCKNALDVRFLSNQLVYWAERQAIAVLSLPKTVVWRQELRGKPLDFARSASSTRFAVAVVDRKGTGEISVLVFDWSMKKRVLEMSISDIRPQTRTDSRQCTVALSPDGKRLVVLLDSKLFCYQLP